MGELTNLAELTNVFWAAIAILVCGGGLSVVFVLQKARADERRKRDERGKFWGAIPGTARTLAGTFPRFNVADWTRTLEELYRADFTLGEATALIGTFSVLWRGGDSPRVNGWDFLDWATRKNDWAITTFGPGDARDRYAGLADHIRKELDELAQDPMNVEEWIDLVFLALDGAYRAGANPRLIAGTLEAKLAKNMARRWPDWRTATPGKAIEHDRSGE